MSKHKKTNKEKLLVYEGQILVLKTVIKVIDECYRKKAEEMHSEYVRDGKGDEGLITEALSDTRLKTIDFIKKEIIELEIETIEERKDELTTFMLKKVGKNKKK